MRPQAPTLQDLVNHLGNSETFMAALAHEVHRFWYDECFSSYTERPFDTQDVKLISSLHNDLWNNSPDWRMKLKDMIKRYQVNDGFVKWVPIPYLEIPEELKTERPTASPVE